MLSTGSSTSNAALQVRSHGRSRLRKQNFFGFATEGGARQGARGRQGSANRDARQSPGGTTAAGLPSGDSGCDRGRQQQPVSGGYWFTMPLAARDGLAG